MPGFRSAWAGRPEPGIEERQSGRGSPAVVPEAQQGAPAPPAASAVSPREEPLRALSGGAEPAAVPLPYSRLAAARRKERRAVPGALPGQRRGPASPLPGPGETRMRADSRAERGTTRRAWESSLRRLRLMRRMYPRTRSPRRGPHDAASAREPKRFGLQRACHPAAVRLHRRRKAAQARPAG